MIVTLITIRIFLLTTIFPSFKFFMIVICSLLHVKCIGNGGVHTLLTKSQINHNLSGVRHPL